MSLTLTLGVPTQIYGRHFMLEELERFVNYPLTLSLIYIRNQELIASVAPEYRDLVKFYEELPLLSMNHSLNKKLKEILLDHNNQDFINLSRILKKPKILHALDLNITIKKVNHALISSIHFFQKIGELYSKNAIKIGHLELFENLASENWLKSFQPSSLLQVKSTTAPSSTVYSSPVMYSFKALESSVSTQSEASLVAGKPAL